MVMVTVALILGTAEAWAQSAQGCYRRLWGDDAIRACSQEIRKNPRQVTAYINRGGWYAKKGDFVLALADFTAAIKIDSRNAIAYYVRGDVYEKMGDLDRALADFTSAINIDNSSTIRTTLRYDSPHAGRAGVHLAKGNIDGAFADASRAIEINSRNANAYYIRGLVHTMRADFSSAAADLQRATEIKDSIRPILFRYLALMRSGNAGERELEADAVRLKDRAWPHAIVELYLGKRSPGATLGSAGKPDDQCEAQFHIGQWHLLRGERGEAKAALTIAADTCRTSAIEYHAATAELKQL